MLWIYSKAVQTFLKLKDTIASYSGLAGKHLKVNSTEDGVDTSTDVDADIHDAVLKKHTQNTDTKLQDGAGVDSVVVNTGGIVDLPKQSGCRVVLSANQSIQDSTVTVIAFDTVDFDNQGEFDTTNYRWTALKTGYYSVAVSGLIEIDTDGKIAWVGIEKNGTNILSNRKHSGVADSISPSAFGRFYLVTGDYIDFIILHNNGSTIDLCDCAVYTHAEVWKDG